jgi:5'-nucleotidase / UDP-sugar diphosphatase
VHLTPPLGAEESIGTHRGLTTAPFDNPALACTLWPMRKYPKLLQLLTLFIITGVFSSGCTTPVSRPPGDPITLTVLYTNDEHGWMAPTDRSAGAAGMLQRWREDEGLTDDGPFLVLSGGDLWTGPALATWFDGESMVDVMNAMGYHAAALGNHEFDFGREGLRLRGDQAEFAFLGANVLDTASGEPIEQALPYIIQDVGELRVGIIGLASTRTPRTTMPTHVAGIDFASYEAALERVVPEVKREGADVVLVISHLCSPEMSALVKTAAALDVAMVGGGHCHERVSRVVEGVALVQAGWRMEAYGRVDLVYDPATQGVRDVSVTVKPNGPGPGDPEVEALIAQWQAELDDALLVTIGYTERGIDRNSAAMHNMVMDAWLAGYPADAALSNPGGFRQSIEAGEITLADIVGVLPFDNTIVDVTLTGQQLIASYNHGSRKPAVGGLRRAGANYTVNGTPLDPQATYRVLVNDFMYAGGDGYAFADYDPDAYMTGIDWRQPLIEWISGLRTSPDDPLENYLDTSQR